MKNLILITGLLLITITTTFAKEYNVFKQLEKNVFINYYNEDFGHLDISTGYMDNTITIYFRTLPTAKFNLSTISDRHINNCSAELPYNVFNYQDSLVILDHLIYEVINNDIYKLYEDEYNPTKIYIGSITKKTISFHVNDTIITFNKIKESLLTLKTTYLKSTNQEKHLKEYNKYLGIYVNELNDSIFITTQNIDSSDYYTTYSMKIEYISNNSVTTFNNCGVNYDNCIKSNNNTLNVTEAFNIGKYNSKCTILEFTNSNYIYTKFKKVSN